MPLLAPSGPRALPTRRGPALALLLVLAGMWGQIGGRGPRQAVALTLSLLLGAFVFEEALHSVHHLTDPVGGPGCAIAAGLAHLVAADTTAVPSVAVPCAPVAAAVAVDCAPIQGHVLTPANGRAPPVLPGVV